MKHSEWRNLALCADVGSFGVGNRGGNDRGLRGGTVNFNANGFPVEAGDVRGNNLFLITPNHNRCGRIWNNLLSYGVSLDNSGEGSGVTGDGTQRWYKTIEGGDFRVDTGACRYTYMADDSYVIAYNPTTGVVALE